MQEHKSSPKQASISPANIEAVIIEGNPELMVNLAKVIGQDLVGAGLTRSQIRNVFGVVRQLDLNWPHHESSNEEQRQAVRQLLLLKPRLAYQAKREAALKGLEKILTPAIDLVGDNRQRFQHLVDFLEAIVAYHTAFGAKN